MSPRAAAPARPDNGWLGPLLVLFGGISVAYAPIGLRFGLDEMGPQAIAFWRYLFAAPLLFALIVMTKRRLPVRPNPYALLAGVFFALDIALWHWGLALTTVANATFIVNLGNLCVGLTAWAVMKVRPPRIWALAAFIAIIGAAFLSLGGKETGLGSINGDLLSLGAALMVSFYMVAAKLARQNMSALDVLFWATITELSVGFLVTLASGERLMPPTPAALLVPASLGLIAHTIGQGLIIAGIGRTSAALAGVIVLIQPVTAAAISWGLFKEPLAGVQIIGAALILIGVLLAQQGELRQKGL